MTTQDSDYAQKPFALLRGSQGTEPALRTQQGMLTAAGKVPLCRPQSCCCLAGPSQPCGLPCTSLQQGRLPLRTCHADRSHATSALCCRATRIRVGVP